MITTTSHGDHVNLRQALISLDAVATPRTTSTPPVVRVNALLAADHLVTGGVPPTGRPRPLRTLGDVERELRTVLRCLAALHPDTYSHDAVLDAAEAALRALAYLEDSR